MSFLQVMAVVGVCVACAATMFALGAVCMLIGVMLGGHLVFRAGGSTSGPLFRLKPDGKEGVAVIDDGFGDTEIDDDLPAEVMDQNERFRAIFGSNLNAGVTVDKKEV